GDGTGRTSADDDEATRVSSGCGGAGRLRGGTREREAAALAADLPASKRVDRRRFEHGPGSEAEGGLVPGADQALAVAHALGKWTPSMRAGSGEGGDGVTVPKQQDLLAVYLDLAQALFRQLADLGHAIPLCLRERQVWRENW